MTILTTSGNQWPLLQSKTEQKFKSGLFNVSAQYIRPVGNDSLPSEIDTSIGPVDVWPEPTVSSGTDGFERINATGYGVWSSDTAVTYGVTNSQINFFAQIDTARYYGDPNACERSFSSASYSVPASAEYCVLSYVDNVNSPLVYPELPRELRVFDEAGEEITEASFDFSKPFPPLNPNDYNFPDSTITAPIIKLTGKDLSIETVGNLKVVTLTYTVRSSSFYFAFIEPDPPECTGWV